MMVTTMQQEPLTLTRAIQELADLARVFGRRARRPEDRLVWAQAEALLREMAKQHGGTDDDTTKA